MGYIWRNALAILAAGLAGALPLLTLWSHQFGPAIALAPLASIWIAAILAGALIIAPVQAGAWVVALATAVILWGGFILPALAVTLAAGGRGPRGIVLAALAWLASLLVQAAVLRAIGLATPPD